MLLFNKYQKKRNDSKVLLLYLLLNGNDMEKVKIVEEAEDARRKVIYGITSEVVNGRQFSQEVESIKAPSVCSPQSYELYSDSKLIHIYTPESEGDLWINDMSVISRIMVIEKNCIVSSNLAKEIDSIEQYGFMYFYNYVINGEMRLENWHVTYKDNLFQIFYTGKEDNLSSDEGKEFLLFSSVEIERMATYKFVLYIISKMQNKITEKIQPDNFKVTDYELVVND